MWTFGLKDVCIVQCGSSGITALFRESDESVAFVQVGQPQSRRSIPGGNGQL